jgi:hypothetical protein
MYHRNILFAFDEGSLYVIFLNLNTSEVLLSVFEEEVRNHAYQTLL